MSNYELPNAMRLSRTANRIKRDRELARLQRRARIKRRRRPGAQLRRPCATQRITLEAERAAGHGPTGEVPF
jgi:hypothetical protein